MVKQIIFSCLAVLAGLFLITVLSEGVEVLVVKISSGKSLSELTQNQAEYFAVRNQPAIIALKLVYNTVAAFIGGYVCAVIAPGKSLTPTLVLAAIQTLGFVYGMTLSEYADTTPLRLWLALTILTIIAIMGAGHLRNRRMDGVG